MRILKTLILVGLLLVGVLATDQPVGAGSTFDEVATELMCQCGCRLTVATCNMPDCSTRKQMGDQITSLVDQGQSKEQIVAYFLSTYGEEALAVPTKQGFNLVAWLMPFAAIFAGLGFVYVVADQWVLRRGHRSTEEEVLDEEVAPSEMSRYEKRLKKELERHEGGS